MAVKSSIKERDGIYFITITCLHWLQLFELTNSYDMVYKWFDYLKNKGHFINGYVIMPNHLHVLFGFRCADKSFNTIISNGKRFMAYEIVKRLQEQNQKDILNKLSDAVTASDKQRGKLHQVFAPSFDCKECLHDPFIEQKLSYIHENPCKGVWNLVKSPVDYLHSSAKFYHTGEVGAYTITNYKELDDIDLTKPL